MNKNLAIVIGRVTADPQLKSTPQGMSVCSFSIATNQAWVDKSGAKKEKTDYHNIVAWGKKAEAIAKWVTKGQELYVEGRLETRKWEDKDKHTHYSTEIILENFSFGQKSKGTSEDRQALQQAKSDLEQEAEEQLPAIDIDEEDIKPENLPF